MIVVFVGYHLIQMGIIDKLKQTHRQKNTFTPYDSYICNV